MKNLKKILLPVAFTALAACVGVGGAILSSADSAVYTAEENYDIIEFIETTDLLSEDGVTVQSGKVILERAYIDLWLSASFGIRFNTQFESNDWEQTEKGLQVTLGVNDVFFALDESGNLDVSIYDNLLDGENKRIQTATLADFDATAMHEWQINRVFTTDGADDGYALRVYVDNTLIVGDEETVYAENTAEGNGGVTSKPTEEYHSLIVRNATGVDVNVYSTREEALTFEEEKDVWDVAELNGEVALFTSAGRTVAATGSVMDTQIALLEWQRGAWSTSSGFAFALKAKQAWGTSADLLVFEIGSTDIRIGYNATTRALSAYVYNWWPTQGATFAKNVLGGRHVLAENFDSTQWHSWKVARVKATNGEGFAVRMYIDDELALELYDPYSLNYKKLDANGNLVYCDFKGGASSGRAGHACNLRNVSGVELAVKSLLDYPAYDSAETYTDILNYGADLGLQEDGGKAYSAGEYVIDTPYVLDEYKEWIAENNGIAFSFQSKEDWALKSDVLQVVLGATDIRVNYEGGKISFHVYSRAHAYGAWGTKITGSWEIDVTEWNTLKILRQKDLNATGAYGELGMRVKVYLNDKLLFTHIQPTGGMWSWAWRKIQVYNRNTGTDVYFKTTNAKKIAFEEVTVRDLPDLPASDKQNYNEDGLHGVGARATINNTERIVNSVWLEEFASISNGGEFIVRSEEPWRTSGTWKNLQALTEEEIAAISAEDFKAGVKNGTYYEENGVKYKFVTGDWTSDWKDSNGNTLSSAWDFPNYWLGDNFTHAYYRTKDNTKSNLLKPEEDMAYRYHLHIDFGIMAIQFKLTPNENLIVRVRSKYSGVIAAENLLVDENGDPVVFKTGKDESGEYYEHHFKIARVRTLSGEGFATMIWIDGLQVVNVYDPGPMGGAGDYAHFLIDNITGRELTVVSVKGLEGYKSEYCASFDSEYAQENYSTEKWNELTAIKEDAKAQMYADSSSMLILANVTDLYKKTHALLSAVWTMDIEERFSTAQTTYKQKLQTLVNSGTYDSERQSQVNALLAQAVAAIDGSEDDFDCLDLLYNEYLEKISAIPTQELLSALATARKQAKDGIAAFIGSLTVADYTADNYAKFATVSAEYEALIDGCADLEEIQTLGLLAVSELQAVESIKTTALNQVKAQAKNEVSGYVARANYLSDDWAVLQTIIGEACQRVDVATSETDVSAIVTAAKADMDAVPVLGTSSMVPSGDSANSGSGGNAEDSSGSNVDSSSNSSNGEQTQSGGCNSRLSSVGFGAVVLIAAMGAAMLWKKRRADKDGN